MISAILEYERVRSAVKTRTIIVAILVHVGLAIEIFGMVRHSVFAGWDLTSTSLLIGLLLLYGGFLLAVFFILNPVWPWIRRIQAVEHWTTALMRDLPAFIENLPKIIGAAEHFMLAWKQSRQATQQQGEGKKEG